jgi:hypothetical protein
MIFFSRSFAFQFYVSAFFNVLNFKLAKGGVNLNTQFSGINVSNSSS